MNHMTADEKLYRELWLVRAVIILLLVVFIGVVVISYTMSATQRAQDKAETTRHWTAEEMQLDKTGDLLVTCLKCHTHPEHKELIQNFLKK